MSSFKKLLVLLTFLTLVACGDDTRVTTDGGTDTGAGDTSTVDTGTTDTGARPDTGTMDTGPTDPCASDEATETVGCNGDILGATQEDDALFGLCTPDAEGGPGSCTDTSALCYAYDADLEESTTGVCVPSCTPNGSTYVNTSTCPAGTRCFDFGDGAGFCFADCNAGTDCVSGQCDGDNSCVGGSPTMMDGGTDGGTDGGADGGTDGGADGGGDAGTDGGGAGDAATDA